MSFERQPTVQSSLVVALWGDLEFYHCQFYNFIATIALNSRNLCNFSFFKRYDSKFLAGSLVTSIFDFLI